MHWSLGEQGSLYLPLDLPVPDHEADTDAQRLLAGRIEALRDASLEFLDGEFALEAVRNGWDEVQLFGVHEGAATVPICGANVTLVRVAA